MLIEWIDAAPNPDPAPGLGVIQGQEGDALLTDAALQGHLSSPSFTATGLCVSSVIKQ